MSDAAVEILVVDDVVDNLTAVEAVLARSGIGVVTARSGTEALEALLVHDFALALIDVHMPGMDGFELAELMRGTERTRHIPIIFFTAVHGETARMFRGYEAGAVDFLWKPLDARLLRSKVETFVELHRQRRLLSQKLRELEETLRLSDMFIAVLGHDLRSPLQSLVLGAALLAMRADDPRAVQASARTIERSARRMSRLVEQLLDLARARGGGGIPVKAVSCDAAELVQAAVQELEPGAAARVTVRASGDLHGAWDHDRLLQVVTNLMANAVQHGAADRPISVDLDGHDAAVVRVTVHNGGHMPPERLRKLFEPFGGAGGREGRSEERGLGLGLFIVDQIVRAHHGEVRVRSEPAYGTSVTVELPRAAQTAA